jgi:hypothetical protein
VVAANQLPSVGIFLQFVCFAHQSFQSSHLARYAEIEECRQSLDKMLEEAFLLSDELFNFQEVTIPFFQRIPADLGAEIDICKRVSSSPA